MEIANLSLAYSAGLLAVLAPCALPMLPSFISYFMEKKENQSNLLSPILFGFMTVLGFLTVFLGIGILPSFAINAIANKVSLVSPLIGIILIIMGLGHFFSNIFYSIPTIQTTSPKGTGIKAFYLYGLGYGAASMACSLPVFILLVLQSASVGGFISIIFMFIAYGLGAATILVPLSIALTFSREYIYQRLITVLPYIKKINAIILVLAGTYMIYYWLT